LKFEKFDFVSINKLLLDRKISCTQIAEYYLTKINEGKNLNAFISVLGEQALGKAKKIDQKLDRSNMGNLAGMVVAIKDNLNTKNEKTTCASKILQNFFSPYDATVIKRLKLADAILIGKTNMDEFAMGSSNENSYFAPVKNPHDQTKVPGGSSGGSAVAVAASMVSATLGSDTGGSIRQPAAFCGVVGIKPTYGRVSRFGLVAFASSLDQIGPLAGSVKDCALLLEVIAGFDEKDSTSAKVPVPAFSQNLERQTQEIKIGLPDEYFSDGLNPEIRDQIFDSVEILKKHGATIIPISLPHTKYAISAYYIISAAEASSNLARYDGVLYGHRNNQTNNLSEMYLKSRAEGFGDEVKRRIMLGTYVLSAGYFKKYYQQAQKVRTLIKMDFEEVFKKCDCIITPTTPTTAFKLGEKKNDPVKMYLSDVYTVSANLAGIPALSMPCGFDSDRMPIGLQIMGKHFDEGTVLNVAYDLEQLVSI